MEEENGQLDEVEKVKIEYWDSMGAAAVAWGVSVSVLKAAKRNEKTVESFRGSRVYRTPELEEFIKISNTLDFGMSEEDGISLKIKKEELRRKEFANDQAEGKYISIEDLSKELNDMAQGIKATLTEHLEGRWPYLAEGKKALDLVKLGRSVVDDICRDLQQRFKDRLDEK